MEDRCAACWRIINKFRQNSKKQVRLPACWCISSRQDKMWGLTESWGRKPTCCQDVRKRRGGLRGWVGGAGAGRGGCGLVRGRILCLASISERGTAIIRTLVRTCCKLAGGSLCFAELFAHNHPPAYISTQTYSVPGLQK